MIRPWRKISSKPLGDFRIFTIRADKKVSPRTGEKLDFFVIDSVNWVNIIAITTRRQIILVEQYRHGTNTVELEVPGGMVHAGDKSPVRTAVRELREETGYEGENAQIIGRVFPNPAIMSNTCFTVLIENCRQTAPVEMDSGEDLITKLAPVKQIPTLVSKGKIRHSLVLCAFYHFERWQKRKRA